MFFENGKDMVIITQRIDFKEEIQETREAVDQRLIQLVITAGYLPLTVSNMMITCHNSLGSPVAVIEKWLQRIKPRAILLSGGNDIGEYPARDETEKFLLSCAKTRRLPVLGICRGLQMMGVWAGTHLVKIDGHVKTRHQLNADNDNWPTGVNSYHNWALAECPDGFRVLARSEDGSIEAIRHIELPWEGWMWHPERESPFVSRDIERLKELFGDSPPG